jgi:hypothetical protein
MKAIWLACALALGIFFSATNTATAQVARNVGEFCGIRQLVCNRTCRGGGDCSLDCTTRLAACRSNGCFHFNQPRPRCFNNAGDLALTDIKLAPNPERERIRRGYK